MFISIRQIELLPDENEAVIIANPDDAQTDSSGVMKFVRWLRS